MKKITVLSIFGTRPEATKMCPLVRELERRQEIESVVLVTAQHREMLDSVTEFFGVKADFDLNIMKPGQTLAYITGGVLSGVVDAIRSMEKKPDIALVHGDTTTSFAAALAAFYEQVTVGHVEAGLRTFDKYSPFPEEMNRCLTTRIASLYFAPTENNRRNLNNEGIFDNIWITGNTGLDAIRYTVADDYEFKDETLKKCDFSQGRWIVMTAHRRENIGRGIENICRAVKRIAAEFEDVNVIYPVHLNRAVRDTVFPMLGDTPRVHLCEPVDVTDMHNLMRRAYLCMSDSGGLQEEAPAFDLPVLVLRTETERPEAADAGTVKVVGVEEEDIYREAKLLLTDKTAYDRMAAAKNPYGDGRASERIADAIIEYFGQR